MNAKFTIFLLAAACLFTIVACNQRAKMKKKFIPKKAKCALNELCTGDLTYPTRAVKNLINKHGKKFQFLNGTVIRPTKESVSLRSAEPENLCKTRKYSVKPRAVYDVKKKLKYIVNEEGFEQVVIYEKCVNQDGSCTNSEIFPSDMETSCKQVYTVTRLLSINYYGKLEYTNFPVPSNCICTYLKLDAYENY